MDDKIISLFWERNEEAIYLCSRTYRAYCYSISFSILHDKEDTEECLNDTWLQAWNAIPPTIPKVLRLFLARICRNLAFDRYRYRKAEKRKADEMSLVLEELDSVIPSNLSTESEVQEQEISRIVNAFLGTLNRRDRGIFIRRYFYVEETKDIANFYEIREENCLVILSRVRQKLRKYLEKEGYFQ